MKFGALVAAVLGAEAVLASPVTLVPRELRADKRLAQRRTKPRVAAANDATIESLTNNTQVSYSQNWAGVVIIGTGFRSVTGTITVPKVREPSGGSATTEYAASAWVGIDGDTCTTAILQTGIDFYVQGTTVSYDAWYEWYPNYAYTFSGLSIHAGDQVKLTVTDTSTSSGTATIQNLSTGQTATHTFTAQSAHLCETNAEWIIEDFEESGSLVPFADFGTITWTNAYATTWSGQVIGIDGGEIIDIRQNGQVLTDCSTTGTETIYCTYE